MAVRRIPHPTCPVEVRRALQQLEDSFFDESSDVDHDATTNFVAAEHVDHSGVSITAGTGLTGGGTIEASRTLSLSHLGIQSLTDPGADRIFFWDESENAAKWLVPDGTTVAITDTTLSVVAGGVDHGGLAGLGDDDHAQYLLANGTRNLTGDLTVDALITIDGRDLSVDGAKLDGIEAGADVTDAANVAAAGAAMVGGAHHDGFSDFVAAEHLSLPNTIANVLSDHDLAAHTGLGLFDSSADVDHGGVGGLADDDHTQYFLADGTRDISGEFNFQPATHKFLFTHNSVSAGGNRCRLAIQGQTSGDQTFLDLYTKDGDRTDDIGVVVWAMGLPTNNTNAELLEFRYDATNNEFAMDTLAGGTGVVRTITLYTSGNRGQFRVETGGGVTLKPAGHEFLFRDNSVSGGGNKPRLAIQPQTSGQQFFLDLFTKDGDSSDDVGVTIWAKGSPTSTTNGELLEFRYDSGNAEFAMDALHGGTGTSRPIGIYTSGNRGQLHLATDGSISMSGALGVTGDITGPNVSSGADPGHTHTGASVPDTSTTEMTNDQGSSIAIGQAVYVSAAGNVKLAKADAAATKVVLGLVLPTTIADSASGLIVTSGAITATTAQWDAVTGGAGGLTAGAIYFLSAGTAGALTSTAPTTDSQYVTRVGQALSTTKMNVSIQPSVLL